MAHASHKKIWIIFSVWTVLIAGFIGFKLMVTLSGTEVLLSVSPVDPLDIFRGQYVDLRYDIGSIPLDDLGSGLADPRPGYVVYASLDTTGGLGSVSMLSADRPARGFYVRGTIERVGADSIFVSYGIESFFVREGLGPEIEQNLRRDARAKVVVDSSGNAVLVGLIAGGKEY